MSKYETYPLLMDDLERLISKTVWPSQGIKVPKGQRSHKAALTWLYDQNPELSMTMDTVIMADENEWLNNSDRNVIFPSSNEVLDKLLGAKADLRTAVNMQMPHKSFVLAMPRDYTHKGMKIPPILVLLCNHAERERIIGGFSRDMLSRRKDRVADKYLNDRMLMLNYRVKDPAMKNANGQLAAYRTVIPESLIPDVLRATNGNDFNEVLGSFGDTYAKSIDLNNNDKELQFTVAKLVLMLGVYASSYPGALLDGYPNSAPPKHIEPVTHKAWKFGTLSMPTDHAKQENEKAYHYRSWHFRQLMDKRYYQGEHATKPIGSRVVFVRDSMVGREIEPETLQ